MRVRAALAGVLAVVMLAGCATPEGNPAAYREEALSTLKATPMAPSRSFRPTVG